MSRNIRSRKLIRVAAGKSKDRFGQPMTIKLSGEVEAWFEDAADQAVKRRMIDPKRSSPGLDPGSIFPALWNGPRIKSGVTKRCLG